MRVFVRLVLARPIFPRSVFAPLAWLLKRLMRIRTFAFVASAALLCLAATGTPGEDFAQRYREYAVAAHHPLASRAGAEILAAGGNAADAAAATMLALGVSTPSSSGLGGGGFALYYRARDRSLTFLDFRERAPGKATPTMFRDAKSDTDGPISSASQIGGLASGVPGEPAGIEDLVRRFGKLPLSKVVEPAARMAEQGVPVSEPIAKVSAAFAAQMKKDATMRKWFAGNANALTPGQLLRQPELAKTIRVLGARGASAIYRGAIAREIVRKSRQRGGILSLRDLARYRLVERRPLSAEHFGHRWVTAPPPSAGGYTLLQSLAILERVPPHQRRRGVALLHALAESWKGPYLDRERYFGDPDHVSLPETKMMAAPRLEARAAIVHPTLAMPPEAYDLPLPVKQRPAKQPDNAGTSHFCVMDAAGNVASVTTTINLPFGARYTAAGMVMNDEMDDFARDVGVANAFGLVGGAPNLPGPDKRPVSTMTPTIVFKGNTPVLCIGAAGGSRIVTATQQVAMNLLLHRMNAKEAVRAPRIHHQAHPNKLRTEEVAPLDNKLVAQLKARGHVHEPLHHAANVQLIHRTRRRGQKPLSAACDPRKGGLPAGN